MRASSAADSYSNFFLSWLSLLPYPTTTTTCSNSSFKTTKDKNVVDLSTKKKTKSKKKVLVEVEEVKVETKNSKMNLPKRMTSDLLSMLEAKRRAASNVYVSHPIRHQTVLFTCILFATLTFASSPVGASIDCFKCVSSNGNNPACEDPFHNNFSSSILETPCMGGRKGRNGLFPATACIKLTGVYLDNGQRILIRTCAVDSGSKTLDTELGRTSHCGSFVLDGRYVRGCLQSCDDADGCNAATRPTTLLSISINFASAFLYQVGFVIILWHFMS